MTVDQILELAKQQAFTGGMIDNVDEFLMTIKNALPSDSIEVKKIRLI
jgi:hypothetical protein